MRTNGGLKQHTIFLSTLFQQPFSFVLTLFARRSLKILLEKYVERTKNDNIAVLDNFGRHPLHIAVASGVSLEATELWIKMFPNSTTHIDTLSNKLPIEISCESEAEEEVILLLLRRCSGVTFKRSLSHIASKSEDKVRQEAKEQVTSEAGERSEMLEGIFCR